MSSPSPLCPSPLPQDLDLVLKTLERRVAEISEVLCGRRTLNPEETLRLGAWDVADTGLCIVDEDGLFVDVNPAYTRIYGYSREELLGQSFTLVLPQEARETGLRALALFFEKDVEPSMEWEVRHKDGSPRRILATAGLLRDGNGRRYKITSVMDVTEARRDREQHLRLGHIFESLKEEIFLLEASTFLFEDANTSALFNSGYRLEELRTLHAWELFMGLSEAEFRELVGDVRTCAECGRLFMASVCRRDNTCYEAELRLQYIAIGKSPVFAMLVRDISEGMRTLRALKESEENLSETQQMAGMGSWKWERSTDRVYWSAEMFRLMGMAEREGAPSQEDFLERVVSEDRDRVREALERAWADGGDLVLEHGVRVGGRLRVMSVSGRSVKEADGRMLRLVGTMQDITEKKEVDAELKKLTLVMEQSANIVFITDRTGTITYVNRMFERVTGYLREEAIGQNPRILASGETRPEAYAALWETILSGKSWRGDFKNRTKSGNFYWGKGLISPVRGIGGEIVNFFAIQEDITEKKQTEERALYLESYDAQTGLLNRDSFIRRLGEVFSGGGAGMLIDIDGFKLVNDQIGYARGDRVLRALIRGVRQVLDTRMAKDSWFMGRFGGDQMAVFVNRTDTAECLALAEEIRSHVEKSRFEDGGVRFTVSSGLALVPEHAGDALTFLAVLDAALGKAKELGKNRCRMFVPEDREGELKRATFYQKQRILDALAADRFEVWYQPILHLSSQTVLHYEALVRLKEPDGRMVLPGAFIRAAESHGLVGSIDRVVAKKTFLYQKALEAKGRLLSFSMNLSGRDLADSGMAVFLKKSMEETGADPRRLIFEITETAAIQDMDRALEFIAQMKSLGCRFSLDDFGVGFTSFAYLRELGVDFIKIDGSFVRNLHERPEDRSVVRAIVQMAREMGIRTVAEFVEKEEILTLLSEMGVDYGQGFFIGKPAPASFDLSYPPSPGGKG